MSKYDLRDLIKSVSGYPLMTTVITNMMGYYLKKWIIKREASNTVLGEHFLKIAVQYTTTAQHTRLHLLFLLCKVTPHLSDTLYYFCEQTITYKVGLHYLGGHMSQTDLFPRNRLVGKRAYLSKTNSELTIDQYDIWILQNLKTNYNSYL